MCYRNQHSTLSEHKKLFLRFINILILFILPHYKYSHWNIENRVVVISCFFFNKLLDQVKIDANFINIFDGLLIVKDQST